MVLGSQDASITYPKSLYYSAKACSIRYLSGSLTFDPGGWDEADNKFLAEHFGLVYERNLPEPSEGTPSNEGGIQPLPSSIINPAILNDIWEAYLERIRTGLERGAAIQVCQGWMGVGETPEGDLFTRGGQSIPWWEGMENRPDMHYLTVVGVDERRDEPIVYLNDPIGGWFGVGKDYRVTMEYFREMILNCDVPQHQYITIIYYRPGFNTIGGNAGENRPSIVGDPVARQRIRDKILGKASVYEDHATWREFFGEGWNGKIIHGVYGLEAMKGDLENFAAVLYARATSSYQPMSPLDTVSYLDLGVYHFSHIAEVASEYPEELGQIEEWEWLFRLHLLYERMWICTSHIRDIFKRHSLGTDPDESLQAAVEESDGHRQDLLNTIDETIEHMLTYNGGLDLPSPLVVSGRRPPPVLGRRP